LIVRHRAEVLAIAEALMVERTLNSKQIDAIIAAAPERARCATKSRYRPSFGSLSERARKARSWTGSP
jgi:hypothetical protein